MSVTVDAADCRHGVRQIAAAVSVIGTEHDGQRAGMIATAVSSLTAEPPQLGVAIGFRYVGEGRGTLLTIIGGPNAGKFEWDPRVPSDAAAGGLSRASGGSLSEAKTAA